MQAGQLTSLVDTDEQTVSALFMLHASTLTELVWTQCLRAALKRYQTFCTSVCSNPAALRMQQAEY